MNATASTEMSIVEDFALALRQLVKVCERQNMRTGEFVRAKALLAQFGYLE